MRNNTKERMRDTQDRNNSKDIQILSKRHYHIQIQTTKAYKDN